MAEATRVAVPDSVLLASLPSTAPSSSPPKPPRASPLPTSPPASTAPKSPSPPSSTASSPPPRRRRRPVRRPRHPRRHPRRLRRDRVPRPWPRRAHAPTEPFVYRLYEIVRNYGYAFKAVCNEKFGDGIMSAIAFSTKVEREDDDQGVAWVVITLRGKW
ncbi:unnamed protein product [Parascedosporium putredinis]|uniref:Cyanate lyase C-terminal domain-containing protein n=1 Tax=Parascedosporium putredinis TaxID=1442378 RepID=A0A9P1M9G5_9PEZI|nr:unnamed protein product [Parascedosporium putredinis]CAI7994790.1 unnamed protein product [Parascedosporium putredinis]